MATHRFAAFLTDSALLRRLARAVEACIRSRPHDGGLVELSALVSAVRRRRGSAAEAVSEDDILRAVQQLRALGGGWDVLQAGPTRLVRSVPAELTSDGSTLLAKAAASGGWLSLAGAVRATGWGVGRCSAALDALTREGVAMVDKHEQRTVWWFVGLCSDALASAAAADAEAAAERSGPALPGTEPQSG